MSPISWVDIIGIIVLPIVGFIIMWLLAIQKDLNEHKLDVANNYTKKDDLNIALNKIENILERIFEKLDALSERRAGRREESFDKASQD